MEKLPIFTNDNFFAYDFSQEIERIAKKIENTNNCEIEDIAILLISTKRIIVYQNQLYIFKTNQWTTLYGYHDIEELLPNYVHSSWNTKYRYIDITNCINKHFSIKFDSNRNIINCGNGVLDFETGKFRDQLPQDLCLTFKCVEFVNDLEKLKLVEFDNELSNIFPDIKNKQAFINIFTSCLIGHRDENMNIWFIIDNSLESASGKTTLARLVRQAFGNYHDIIPWASAEENWNVIQLGSPRILACDIESRRQPMLSLNNYNSNVNIPYWVQNPKDFNSTISDFFGKYEILTYTNKFTPNDNIGRHFASKTSEFLYILFNNANSLKYVRDMCNCSQCRGRLVNVLWPKLQFLWFLEGELIKDIIWNICNFYTEI